MQRGDSPVGSDVRRPRFQRHWECAAGAQPNLVDFDAVHRVLVGDQRSPRTLCEVGHCLGKQGERPPSEWEASAVVGHHWSFWWPRWVGHPTGGAIGWRGLA